MRPNVVKHEAFRKDFGQLTPLVTRDFCGVDFVAAPKGDLVHCVLGAASERHSKGFVVHLIPAHSLAEVQSDLSFSSALKSKGLVIPDGRWIEILTRKDDLPLSQLRGSDLMLETVDRGRESGLAHYLLGPSTEVLSSLASELGERFPGAILCGAEVYPFGSLSEPEKRLLIDRIVQIDADLVWFGISSPRQNKEAVWISQQTRRVVACVGAAFEFVSGSKEMAPKWVQRAGLEWLHRFISEPKRLWRRYLLGSVDFVRLYLAARRSS